MHSLILVKATFDDEARVWFTESADLPGLRIEAESIEDLQAKLPIAIQDLLEGCDDDDDRDCWDVPIELVAYASSRVRIRAMA